MQYSKLQTSQLQKILLHKISESKQSLLSIQEIKNFLRIDGDHEDANLNDAIKSVIAEVERKTNFAILQSEWKLKVLNFSGNYIAIPKVNAKQIIKIMVEVHGKTLTLDRSEYTLSEGIIWFRCAMCAQIINIHFVAGYKNAKEINPEVYMAIKQRIASVYENQNLEYDYFQPFRQYRL